MDKNNKQNIEKYWKEKELEINEKIKGKQICEYISGYQELKEQTWGLLYYTQSSFYFQTFPKKNWVSSLLSSNHADNFGKTRIFRKLWKDIEEINLPSKRNIFLAFFSPPDYRVFIEYHVGSKVNTLIFMMSCRENRDQFMEDYRKYKNI